MRAFIALALCLLSAEAAARTVTVFAAASMAEAVTAIAEAFTARTGTEIRISTAGSSTLARQIIAGAPADLFISANIDWAGEVEAAGRLEPDSRRVIAGNRLSVIGPVGSAPATSVEAALLRLGRQGYVVMGDPEHVPAGIYARAALENLELWPMVQRQIVPAPDVRRALALVARGEAPLGIVYDSDLRLESAVTAIVAVPDSAHPPILYVAGIVPPGSDAARDFLDFLTEPAARRILIERGFRAP